MIEDKRIQQKIHLDYIKPQDYRCFVKNFTFRGALYKAFQMLLSFVSEKEN